MNVVKITDREDGGADLELELTEEEVHALVEYAVIAILKEYVAKEKEKTPKKRDKFDRNSLNE